MMKENNWQERMFHLMGHSQPVKLWGQFLAAPHLGLPDHPAVSPHALDGALPCILAVGTLTSRCPREFLATSHPTHYFCR